MKEIKTSPRTLCCRVGSRQRVSLAGTTPTAQAIGGYKNNSCAVES